MFTAVNITDSCRGQSKFTAVNSLPIFAPFSHPNLCRVNGLKGLRVTGSEIGRVDSGTRRDEEPMAKDTRPHRKVSS